MKLCGTVALNVVVCLFALSSAFATQQRSFVSATGSDVNACTRDLPCRNFAAAVAQTNPNGEVIALDSAGYGPVTLTQSVTIAAPPGVYAGITVPASPTTGVTVNVGPAGKVVLRNLSINGQGGTKGVDLIDALSLQIEHCTINGLALNGLNLVSSSDSNVYISDTTVRHCASFGIYADSASTLKVNVSNSLLDHNSGSGFGADRAIVAIRNTVADGNTTSGYHARGNLAAVGGLKLSLEDSFASNNVFNGVKIENATVVVHGGGMSGSNYGFSTLASSVSSVSTLLVDGTAVSNNGTGISVVAGAYVTAIGCSIIDNNSFGIRLDPGAFLQISRNTITNNFTGLGCSGAVAVSSTADNIVDRNATNNVACTFALPNMN
jgi:parallel beta helix pectate lyase-like protein